MSDTFSSMSWPTEPRPADEVPPVDEPPVRRESLTGVHVLERGETPATLARKLFGRGSLAGQLVAANPGVQWRPGAKITIPDIT